MPSSLLLRVLVMWLAIQSASRAAYIAIGDVGDTFGSATNVDAWFDLSADPIIFNDTTIPHVSITSSIESTSDVDWYSFTGDAGNSLDVDIDYAWTGSDFDSTLALFDSTAALLAYTDDMFGLDNGSFASTDSFLGTYILPYTGLYYLAVSSYPNLPDGIVETGLTFTTPNGDFGGFETSGGAPTFSTGGAYSSGTYTLHVSTAHSAVPEPTSLVLLGLGGLGMAVGVARRRRIGTQVPHPNDGHL